MSENKELLAYYQDKVDQLYKERLIWRSKFGQSNTLLKQKQKLMDLLKDHKQKELDLHRGIVHHDVVLLDQKLNVIRMERENINNEYIDAQQILKMQELVEQYPQELQKHLPCNVLVNPTEIIDNELNIHAASKATKKNSHFNIFRENNYVLRGGSEKEKIKYKPSKQELIRRQIIQLKTSQDKEIVLLNEQKRKLQYLLKSVRDKEEQALINQRDVIDKLKNQYKKQQQKHKNIAQKYFDCRKKLRLQHNQTKGEGQKLRETFQILQKKVNEEMKIYQKENKAKQTLIIRKSEDFQQNYKAKMRAKQHNLQALRDNYQKMQQVCIEKIRKLEETLTTAKHRLNQTEEKREQQITQLKKELFALQKQVGEERVAKARTEEKVKQKVEEQKRRRLMLQQKEEQERRKNERATKIEQAYKKPTKIDRQTISSKKNTQKSDKKVRHKKEQTSQEQSEEQSMAMSDLQNINQQINKLSIKLQGKIKKGK